MPSRHPSPSGTHPRPDEALPVPVPVLAATHAELRDAFDRLRLALRTGPAVINVHDLAGPAPDQADRIAQLEARNAELEQVVAQAQAALPEGDRWLALALALEDGPAALTDEQVHARWAADAEDAPYRALLDAANAGDQAAYNAAYDAIQANLPAPDDATLADITREQLATPASAVPAEDVAEELGFSLSDVDPVPAGRQAAARIGAGLCDPASLLGPAERAELDLDVTRMMAGRRGAVAQVLGAAADRVSQRSEKLTLEQVCARLGLDAAEIRTLAEKQPTGGLLDVFAATGPLVDADSGGRSDPMSEAALSRLRARGYYREDGPGAQEQYDQTPELQELLAEAAASPSVVRPATSPSDPAQPREDAAASGPAGYDSQAAYEASCDVDDAAAATIYAREQSHLVTTWHAKPPKKKCVCCGRKIPRSLAGAYCAPCVRKKCP